MLVEDDLVLASELGRALEAQSYAVTHALDGRTGLDLARGGTFDVMVVDRMLPDLDGLTLVSHLRAEGVRTPVLFLTALGRVDERVRGLTVGGDDYVTKPFDMAELVARLEVIQRRGVPDGTATMLELGPLRLDLLERKAFRDGRDLGLLPHEFRLLAFLVRQNGRLVTREMLLERVWNYRFIPDSNVVNVHISKLRRKLEVGAEAPLISTVRGQGFILRVPD